MSESQFREIWVDGPSDQSLCAIVNGQVGWLMYLRESGDPGFSSRNPDYGGPEDAVITYVLANGQHDTYPAAWAYSLATVEAAITYFRSQGTPPPFITWHNEAT